MAQVFDENLGVFLKDLGVFSGNRRVLNLDVVVRVSSDEEALGRDFERTALSRAVQHVKNRHVILLKGNKRLLPYFGL